MGILAKLGALFLLLIIVIAFLYFFERSIFCNIFSSVMNPNISAKICVENITNTTSHKIITMESNAIENSSTIPIIHWAIFGTWANITKNISPQEQAYFGDNFYQLYVLYYRNYVPISVFVQAFGNSAPNLIGQKVYLDFILNNNENISAPYIVKSEVIKNNEEYWNFTFDGSTNNAINSMLNLTTANITTAQLNGIIVTNGTAFLSPKNPAIYALLHKKS